MPVLEGEERKVDIWADLAKQIIEDIMPEFSGELGLEHEVEASIQKFVKERIVICYFKCKEVK
jgi:hypothetical protein